jgi:hypothetical protein
VPATRKLERVAFREGIAAALAGERKRYEAELKALRAEITEIDMLKRSIPLRTVTGKDAARAFCADDKKASY